MMERKLRNVLRKHVRLSFPSRFSPNEVGRRTVSGQCFLIIPINRNHLYYSIERMTRSFMIPRE